VNPWDGAMWRLAPTLGLPRRYQADSLLPEDLVEPGSFVTPYPILHFFTEYDAPSRRPSGMLVVCSGPAAFEPAPMMKSSVPPNAPVTLFRGVKGLPSNPFYD
jgi:hypothetical protein